MDVILEGTGCVGKTSASKRLPGYVCEVSKGFGRTARKLLITNEFFETGNSELETILLAIDWNTKIAESTGRSPHIFDRGFYSIMAYQSVKEHLRSGISLEVAAVNVMQIYDLVSDVMGIIIPKAKTILLTADKKTLAARYVERNKCMRGASIDVLLAIQDFYLEFKQQSWLQLDTSNLEINEVSEYILSVVQNGS